MQRVDYILISIEAELPTYRAVRQPLSLKNRRGIVCVGAGSHSYPDMSLIGLEGHYSSTGKACEFVEAADNQAGTVQFVNSVQTRGLP